MKRNCGLWYMGLDKGFVLDHAPHLLARTEENSIALFHPGLLPKSKITRAKKSSSSTTANKVKPKCRFELAPHGLRCGIHPRSSWLYRNYDLHLRFQEIFSGNRKLCPDLAYHRRGPRARGRLDRLRCDRWRPTEADMRASTETETETATSMQYNNDQSASLVLQATVSGFFLLMAWLCWALAHYAAAAAAR